MIISIGGAQGSGKSTLAQSLAKKLGWPRYYIGGLRREAAKKRGLTLVEYNQLGETDPATDKEVDEYQEELGRTQDNFVIEGRTSWHFIPQSLKIYLDIDEEVAAKRIYQNLQEKNEENSHAGEDKNLDSWQDVLASMRNRIASDYIRYQKYYGVDVYDQSHYDFCLNTTNLTKDQVFAAVYNFVQANIDKGKV